MFRKSATLATYAILLLLALFGAPGASLAEPAQGIQARIEAALQNILMLERPDEDGLATIWDGNKYVQCRRTPHGALLCEAAGARLQPTLGPILTPEKLERLTALGWRLDPAFGNYAQAFPPGAPVGQVAGRILQTLSEGYDADAALVEVRSDWIASEPCPPRNGPSQNLAGMINDAPAMASTAIHACAFMPDPDFEAAPAALSTDTLIARYGARVTGEIQRLQVNADREVFFALNTNAGYVQCQPQTSPRGIYCEAESAQEWPVLASVLTPERLARLHAAGFADPGRAPNYAKNYPSDGADPAAIAHELLSLLHDVYGYGGSPELKVTTEKSR